MSAVFNLQETLQHLPFSDLPYFHIKDIFSSPKERIVQLMDNYCLADFINEPFVNLDNESFISQACQNTVVNC